MANNCLVTKLKSSVSNEGLPVLDILALDYIYSSNYRRIVFGLKTGENNIVFKCKDEVTYKLNGVNPVRTLAANTSMTITANTLFEGTALLTSQSNVNDYITVEHFYNLTRCLVKEGNTDTCIPIIDYNKGNSNISSMMELCALDGVSFSVVPTDMASIKLNNSIQKIVIDLEGSTNIINIDKVAVLPNVQHIQIVNQHQNSAGGIEITNYFKTNSSIKYICANIYANDFSCFPKNLEFITSGRVKSAGNLEDIISSFVSRGRTTGTLMLHGATICSKIFYNNVAIATLIGNQTIPSFSGTAYVSWNNDTITFEESVPSGFDKYSPNFNTTWVPYTE